jgi:small subunit ribosomal protein S17
MGIKEKIGIVVSNKMQKTIVLLVEHRYSHSVYNKIIKKTKNFMAHDELNECSIGDKVLIAATRPISRKKRWYVKQILTKIKMSK